MINMNSISMRFAIISLLVSTQVFASAYVESFSHGSKSSAKVITNLLKVPWINLNSAWADEVAPTCRNDIATLFGSADAGEMWALQMLDASSKIPAGILTGNIRDLGMYDQCIRVKAHQNSAKIQGQHCMVSMSMPPKYVKDAAAILYVQQVSAYNPSAGVNLSLTTSLCLPSSCGVDDITGLVNASLRSSPDLAEFEVKVKEVTCSDVKAFDNFTLGTILTISVVLVLAVFLMFCTACEYVVKKKSDNASSTLENLAKFSLYSNTLRLWSTDVSEETIPALNGIRFFSICVIVIGHRMMATDGAIMVNLAYAYEMRESWITCFASIASFSVDNFFVLSGFFLTNIFLQKMRAGEVFTIPEMYSHRYIRLVPCVIAVILFTAFIIPYLGSGPIWQTIVPVTSGFCQKNWWTNLLFVQNLINQEEMCLPHTWYLAADMQLFILSPLILYPLFYRPKLGLSILGILSIGGFILPIIEIYRHQYPSFFHGNEIFSKCYHDMLHFYTVTYNRALPYFIGMLLGYYVLNVKRELTKAQAAFIWSLAFPIVIFILWSGSYIQPISAVYNVGWEATHASLGRLLWSVTFAWIVYACLRGHGGPITRFCSLPIFVPLCRLSYGMYVSSAIIQVGMNSTIRTAGFLSISDMLYIIGSDIAVSMVAAIILKLGVEVPAIVLEKIIRAEQPSEIIKPESTKSEDKVLASIAEMDPVKDRDGSYSISSRMLQQGFWQDVSDVLNTLGKSTAKSPTELAKAWQDWESALMKNRSQRKICARRSVNEYANGYANGHAKEDGNGYVNGVQNRTAKLQTDTTQLEKRLLFFLAAVSDCRNDNGKLKGL